MEDNKFALTADEFEMFKDVKTASLDQLENFDFSSDKELVLDEFHEMVNLYKVSQNPTEEKKEVLKSLEAENVIKSDSEKFLGKEITEQYHKQRENLKAFLRRYEVNTDTVKNMTETEKDKIYDIAEYLFSNYQKIHNNLNFIFPLTFEEYKFIVEVIIRKLEYDRDGVFQVRELNKNYLGNYTKFQKDINGNDMTTWLDINSMMILYHHITRYKIKGHQTEATLFVNIITKLEERLMLYNAYKILTERLSQEFQVWGGSLTIDDIGLKVEDTPSEQTTQPETELKVVDEMSGKEVK